ncbi:hypothetical protein FACS1894185_3220 [Betaproteobacteria bacterium]|nr:hypothetical protein FACS1894185_3220 [Betaproteobacteria bacterium]
MTRLTDKCWVTLRLPNEKPKGRSSSKIWDAGKSQLQNQGRHKIIADLFGDLTAPEKFQQAECEEDGGGGAA